MTAMTDELLDLSRAMLAAAAAQDWEQVTEIESRRSALLATYDATRDRHFGRDYVQNRLKEMLEINQSVLELGLKARDELKDNLGTLQRGIRAEQAYRQNE